MVTYTNRKRQPKGIPVGGQFASNEHDEASALTTTTARGTVLPSISGMTPEELVAQSRRAISVYGERRRMTPEQQEEAVAALVEDMWRYHGATYVTPDRTVYDEEGNVVPVESLSVEDGKVLGEDGKPLIESNKIDGATLNKVARLHVANALSPTGKRLVGANGQALTELAERVDRIEESEGRIVSESEIAKISDEIIDNWYDQGHKPTRGFQNMTRRDHSISDVPGSYDGDDYIHPALIDPYSPEVAVMESQNERAADILDSMQGAKGAKERNAIIREARANAWSIVAEHRDVPTVKAKLTDASRKTILSHVKNSGGAAAVAERYERGESDSATEALFMPFRERIENNGRVGWRKLSDAQMDAISDMIRSNPKMADELWASALAAAK